MLHHLIQADVGFHDFWLLLGQTIVKKGSAKRSKQIGLTILGKGTRVILI